MLRFSVHPRGAKVIALWTLLPGLVLTPFVVWQSLAIGIVFGALWLFFSFVLIPLRLTSFEGSVSLGEVRVSQGILFKTSHRLPTRFVTGVNRIRTPLLQCAECSILVVYTSGSFLVLPGISDDLIEPLTRALHGGLL